MEKRVTNNVVLKKLCVAFELNDVDMHLILAAAGFPIARPEPGALFRQPITRISGYAAISSAEFFEGTDVAGAWCWLR